MAEKPVQSSQRATVNRRGDVNLGSALTGPEVCAYQEIADRVRDSERPSQPAPLNELGHKGGRAQRRVALLPSCETNLNSGAELTFEAKRGESDKLIPAGYDFCDALVARTQRPGDDGLADLDP